MKQKNLLKTSIELINKIEKENDEYFSRQMASYSKIFSELKDLKELIQKEDKQKMIDVDVILKHCCRFEKVFKVKIIYINYETNVIIYIECGAKIRTERAKKRGGFDKQEWDRRLKKDDIDFDIMKRSIVNRTIDNENQCLDDVVKEIVNG